MSLSGVLVVQHGGPRIVYVSFHASIFGGVKGPGARLSGTRLAKKHLLACWSLARKPKLARPGLKLLSTGSL